MANLSNGLPPLPTRAAMATVRPTVTTAGSTRPVAVPARGPDYRFGGFTADQLPLIRTLPVPPMAMIAAQAIIATPALVSQCGIAAAIQAPGAHVVGMALAWTEGNHICRHGIWTPRPVRLKLPVSLGSVVCFQGKDLPEPLAQLLRSDAVMITASLLPTQKVWRDLGWPESTTPWMDARLLTARVNRDDDLDELMAWIQGARPPALAEHMAIGPAINAAIGSWAALRDYTGLAELPVENITGLLLRGIAALRVTMTVAALWDVGLDSNEEELALTTDRRINATGLPLDVPYAKHLKATLDLVGGATGKIDEVLRCRCVDDSVRGAYGFLGQFTGRWSCRTPNLHNLRKVRSQDESLRRLGLLSRAVARGDGPRAVDLLTRLGTPRPAIATMLEELERTVIAAPEGQVLVVGDLSQAEPRGLFWFAGMRSVLVQMDTADLYVDSGLQTALFGNVISTDHPDAALRRTIGKIAVIGCGYGMGADTLASYARDDWDLDLFASGIDPKRVVEAYRERFAPVKRMWHAVGAAGLRLLRTRCDQQTQIGWLRLVDEDVHLVLPTDRRIIYPDAKEVEGEFGPVLGYRKGGVLRGVLATAWGGVLVQNATTGLLRDVLAWALVQVEMTGFLTPIGHTHDEVICLCPAARADEGKVLLKRIMEHVSAALGGLPMTCKAYVTERLGMKDLLRWST